MFFTSPSISLMTAGAGVGNQQLAGPGGDLGRRAGQAGGQAGQGPAGPITQGWQRSAEPADENCTQGPIAFDLGASRLAAAPGSPFAIPLAQWAAIDDFFERVNTIDPAASAGFADVLPGFVVLKAGAATWQAKIRPGLVRLAEHMSGYGADFVNAVAPALAAMVAAWHAGRPSSSDRAAVATLLTPMLLAASANAAIAGTLSTALHELASMIDQVNLRTARAIDTAPDQAAAALDDSEEGRTARIEAQVAAMAQRQAPLAALRTVAGLIPLAQLEHLRTAWRGVATDLGAFQGAVVNAMAVDAPCLTQIDLDIATLQWNSVAREAGAFTASMA